ncbi:MAG: LapA family protein [Candidatus Tritonobacter lacicola]|nr:LapA family protein [Candidatus Tritonobacter lacicola]
MQAKLIAGLIVIILVIIFTIWNQAPVEVSFVFWSIGPWSVSIVVFFSILIGAVVTFCIGLQARLTLNRELKAKSERIAELEHRIKAGIKSQET